MGSFMGVFDSLIAIMKKDVLKDAIKHSGTIPKLHSQSELFKKLMQNDPSFEICENGDGIFYKASIESIETMLSILQL